MVKKSATGSESTTDDTDLTALKDDYEEARVKKRHLERRADQAARMRQLRKARKEVGGSKYIRVLEVDRGRKKVARAEMKA